MTLVGSGGAQGDEASRVPEAPTEDGERWRLVVVAAVSMELPAAYPEVLLRESVAPHREVRIPVGLAEGTAIAHAWRRMATPRPLTHELITEILNRHKVTLEAVRITERRGQAFCAELETMGPNGRQVVSCRPSDAIALALRQPLPTPMLVVDEVFAEDEPEGI
jgi:uncharacterized protein